MKYLGAVGAAAAITSLVGYLLFAYTVNEVGRAIAGMADLEPWDSDYYD